MLIAGTFVLQWFSGVVVFPSWNTFMGVLKCERIKRLGGFAKLGILVKADWVCHFWGFAGETLI
jgi:hypothetical protein